MQVFLKNYYGFNDIFLFIIYYLSISIFHVIFLAIMERSVAISILQAIKMKNNNSNILELKKIININHLVKLRLMNLIKNKIIIKRKNKIILTKFGLIFHKIIIFSKKIFL